MPFSCSCLPAPSISLPVFGSSSVSMKTPLSLSLSGRQAGRQANISLQHNLGGEKHKPALGGGEASHAEQFFLLLPLLALWRALCPCLLREWRERETCNNGNTGGGGQASHSSLPVSRLPGRKPARFTSLLHGGTVEWLMQHTAHLLLTFPSIRQWNDIDIVFVLCICTFVACIWGHMPVLPSLPMPMPHPPCLIYVSFFSPFCH